MQGSPLPCWNGLVTSSFLGTLQVQLWAVIILHQLALGDLGVGWTHQVCAEGTF